MNNRFRIHLLLPLLAVALIGCRQAKYVPDGYYLLSENNTKYYSEEEQEWDEEHELIDEGDLEDLIRPETNSGIKLWIYNRIDTTRYKKQVIRKRKKFKKKNERRQAKADKINQKRIKKAKKKGKEYYKKKTKKYKEPKLGWRHWVITHWGQAPIVLDTAKISKTKQQMKVFLSKRGFKYAEISDSITYNEKKRKSYVTYNIKPGKPYIINSIKFDPDPRNKQLEQQYKRMVRKEGTDIDVGEPLDEDNLDDQRDHYTKFLKDNAFFGFNKNYINFIVDTTIGDFKADITIYIKEKEVTDPRNPDTTTTINHFTYYVDDITYKLHNIDSASFKEWETYKKRCDDLGLYGPNDDYKDENGHYFLLDTMFVVDTVVNKYFLNFNKNRRKDHDVGIFEKCIDTAIYYKGYFIYNEIPYLKPSLLDKQNFLEHTNLERNEKNFAKDYYIDRTFKSFLRLDVFSKITPTVEIDPASPLGRYVDVTYDLTPQKKQIFTIEPRATNTSSILGISGRISYTNKNLYRAGHQLTITVEGGMQSQPLVGTAEDDTTKRFQFRGLNTFEIGPEINYVIPRFFPMTKKMQENISKRSYPSTIISSLYNFQKRPEFRRHIAELNYRWKFSIPPDEIQRITVTPLFINYVFLKKEASFDSALVETNDPFLINSYSDFFSVGVLNMKHEFTNAALPKHKRNQRFLENSFSNVVDLAAAGLWVNTIYALADKNLGFTESFNDTGKVLFGVPFAQYAKLTNTFTYNMYINSRNRIAMRLLLGAGFTYGNGFALPYTQSYVAGGSNDIRAFPARTMAPGGTQTWRDSSATETQIGDVKLEWNLEWRFKLSSVFHGAVFADIGNIWKLRSDTTAAVDLGLFQFNRFIEQMAIGIGAGLRVDLSFLIIRLDLSWPLYNPYLDQGGRWWLAGDKSSYLSEFEDEDGNVRYRDLPHTMRINFGIGYPF